MAIPFAAVCGEFHWAFALSGLVLIECAMMAGRYTEERTDNFDIYLPLWLARYNKVIFGTLFALGELFLLARWITDRISGRI